MARSDIHRNFCSGGRFGVGVGTQELGGLSGWTRTELELTQLPFNPTVTFLSPQVSKQRHIHNLEKKKN